MFFILFAGNMTTTIMVIPDKLKERVKLQYRLMSQSILKKRKFLEVGIMPMFWSTSIY